MEVLAIILMIIGLIIAMSLIAFVIFIFKLFINGIAGLFTYIVSNIWTVLITLFVIALLIKMCQG